MFSYDVQVRTTDPMARQLRWLDSYRPYSRHAEIQFEAIVRKSMQLAADPWQGATDCQSEYCGAPLYLTNDGYAAFYHTIDGTTVFLIHAVFDDSVFPFTDVLAGPPQPIFVDPRTGDVPDAEAGDGTPEESLRGIVIHADTDGIFDDVSLGLDAAYHRNETCCVAGGSYGGVSGNGGTATIAGGSGCDTVFTGTNIVFTACMDGNETLAGGDSAVTFVGGVAESGGSGRLLFADGKGRPLPCDGGNIVAARAGGLVKMPARTPTDNQVTITSRDTGAGSFGRLGPITRGTAFAMAYTNRR